MGLLRLLLPLLLLLPSSATQLFLAPHHGKAEVVAKEGARERWRSFAKRQGVSTNATNTAAKAVVAQHLQQPVFVAGQQTTPLPLAVGALPEVAPMTPLPSVQPAGGPPVTSAPSAPGLQGAALDLNFPPFSNAERHVSIPGQNEHGVPMGNSMVRLFNGKMLTYDEVFYGMNQIWQDLGLWMMEKWHGVTFMQNPNDAIVLQQLIWDQKPELLIEIGTHAGGSALFYSDIMQKYEAKPGATHLFTMDPGLPQLDPKVFDKKAYPNVEFMQGLSHDPKILKRAYELHAKYPNTLLIHDGDHSLEGVLRDLELYDPLIPVGSYMVVQDTALDRMSDKGSAGGMAGGAYQGVAAFLQGKGAGRYVIDKRYEFMLFSVHHNGWLKKVAP